jgi:hypothetical protein
MNIPRRKPSMPENGTPPDAENVAAGDPVAYDSAEDFTGPLPMPVPPVQVVEAARMAPDHYIGFYDSTWSGEGQPPDWTSSGQWRTDEHGTIVDWEENEDYRPSPRALGWLEPVGAIDAAVQLAATGYGPEEAVLEAFHDAELAVYLEPGGDLSISVLSAEGGRAVAVTSAEADHDKEQVGEYEVMAVTDLLARIPDDCDVLFLSPSSPVSMVVESSDLRQARPAETEEPAQAHGDGDTNPPGGQPEEISGEAAPSSMPPPRGPAGPDGR